MYSVGSLFYAIYFFVSFPMFFRMDEEVVKVSSMREPGLAAAGEDLHPGMPPKQTCALCRCRRLSPGATSPLRPPVPCARPLLVQARHYSLWRAAVDALAAGMLVTCLLDFWRIGLGGIVDGGASGLPWMGW